jgi:hypothetical protein
MLLQLVKKEFLLGKKYAMIMPLIAVIFPLIVTSDKGMDMSPFVFLWTALAIQISLTGSISVFETKNRKGAALLCAVPYTRSMNVKAKYLFDLLIFACYCVIYKVESLVIPGRLMKLDWFSVGIVLLVIVIFRGVFIPLEIKFGYAKTKYASMIFVFIIPFVLPTLMNRFGIDLSAFSLSLTDRLTEPVMSIIPFLLVFIAEVVSLNILISLYSKKEL